MVTANPKPRPLRAWLPQQLMSRARELPLEAFTHFYHCAFFLVIVLDGPQSELAEGLREGEQAAATRADGLGFRTEHYTREGPSSSTFAGMAGSSSRPSMAAANRLSELRNQCCYVAPLRKRQAVSFLSFISIGRARNHDIVLRHPSVSKFHASLEILNDELFIKDAGSRNHTFVNHEAVTERTLIRSGDNLRFGWVEGLVCSSSALWKAAQARV